jgi:uncharacterized DUF497 family protein
MRDSFDPAKQAANLKKHRLDLADAPQVIESGQTVTYEDRRFDYSEERFVTLGPLTDMSKASTVKTSLEARDDTPLRRNDISSGKLVLRKRGANGAVLPNKQRVNIFLDGAVIEYFKAKAGERGYQTLINEALKLAIQAEAIETVVRRTIREELRRT